MKINLEFAENFAREWIEAWNSRDLTRIMALYAEDIKFHSPSIGTVMQSDACFVTGLKDLRNYWAEALNLIPNLKFTFDTVLLSSDALTILYNNERGLQVAESFVFDSDGLVTFSIAAKR